MLRRPSKTSRRLGATGFALLQLGAAAVLPAADAVLDGSVFGLDLHVESPEHECTAHHGHLYCQIVRSLSVQAGTPSATVVRSAEAPQRLAPFTDSQRVAPRAALLAGSVGPRAPPLA